MRRSCFIITFLVGLSALAAGCGGGTTLLQPANGPDATATTGATIGTIDLSQAPAEFAMMCDQGVGRIVFDDPCLVGHNLSGNNSSPGVHEVECTFEAPSHPLAWTFLLILSNPKASLRLPEDLPRGSPIGKPVTIDERQAGISSLSGTLTFSRVDPAGRAFVAHLSGTVNWMDSAGATFSCAVDAPLWGAPGGFT